MCADMELGTALMGCGVLGVCERPSCQRKLEGAVVDMAEAGARAHGAKLCGVTADATAHGS